MSIPKPTHDFEPVENLVTDAIMSKALMESVRMKLYDALTGFVTLSEVCANTKTAERPMEALLDLLVAANLLTKTGEKYANAPVATEFLVSSSQFYQGDLLALHEEFNERAIFAFGARLRGKAVSNVSADQRGACLNALLGPAQFAIRGCLQDTVEFVSRLPGFESMRSMADVGGNRGHYTMALLDLNQALTATIMDLPRITPLIETACRESGYADRVSVAGLDLRYDELPAKAYDLVLVSHVLHMFFDNLSDVIRRIAGALNPGGWFVSQNMNTEIHSPTTRTRVRELVTRLMGYPTHFLESKTLEAALKANGFTNFRTASTGPDSMNIVCAAQLIDCPSDLRSQ